MEMNLHWINAKEELPDASREVLCITEAGTVTSLVYSEKYKLFNVRDQWSEKESLFYKINVLYWADIPEEINRIWEEYVDNV